MSENTSPATTDQLAVDAVYLAQIIEESYHHSSEIAVHADDFSDLPAATQAVAAAKNKDNPTKRRVVHVPAHYGIRGAHADLDTISFYTEAPNEALMLLIEIDSEVAVSKTAQIPVLSSIKRDIRDALRELGDDEPYVTEMIFALHPPKRQGQL